LGLPGHLRCIEGCDARLWCVDKAQLFGGSHDSWLQAQEDRDLMALATQADLPACKDLVRQLCRDTPAPRPLAHRDASTAKLCANVFNSTNMYDAGHDG